MAVVESCAFFSFGGLGSFEELWSGSFQDVAGLEFVCCFLMVVVGLRGLGSNPAEIQCRFYHS